MGNTKLAERIRNILLITISILAVGIVIPANLYANQLDDDSALDHPRGCEDTDKRCIKRSRSNTFENMAIVLASGYKGVSAEDIMKHSGWVKFRKEKFIANRRYSYSIGDKPAIITQEYARPKDGVLTKINSLKRPLTCDEGGEPCIKANKNMTVSMLAQHIENLYGLDSNTVIAASGWKNILSVEIDGSVSYTFSLANVSKSMLKKP